MNAKEAVKKIKIWYQTYLANNTSIFNDDEAICEIIDLLERGEKYEHMWGEMNILYGDKCEPRLIMNIIKRVEAEYFPKLKEVEPFETDGVDNMVGK